MEIQASSSGTSSQSQQPSLNDCLKLLRGERDEQRLAGLLLVTKFCSKDDHGAIQKVYDAVGAQFLHRLLRTGMGKGEADGGRKENRDAYLQLSITVLSAFCRVPEIAASEDVVTKIPLILEVMSQEYGFNIPVAMCVITFMIASSNA
ncbi:PREDICTED: neurochondrin-like [Ipomoea nil]|uniref:neurochondrin-like n=1 Tax=Ipomoea nil TaxID=35883 RepID=UPI000901E175|nr:PREDICTED: neurochondrin-like [Ipomoea nil]